MKDDIPTVFVKSEKEAKHLQAFAEFAHSLKDKPFRPKPEDLVIKDVLQEAGQLKNAIHSAQPAGLMRQPAKPSISKVNAIENDPEYINPGTTSGMVREVRLPDTEEYSNIMTLSDCMGNININAEEQAEIERQEAKERFEKKKKERRSISHLFSYNK